ncbi:Aspartate--tRNA(Asp/Asn) ligase [Nymphon striatum]|nr:Aspartate--tRNA(Asp/Asn) ligase [Nymphon striatum]
MTTLSERYRSHTCEGLRKSDVGNTIRISGWVHRVRDHGGVLFIDLRDHYGMTQVVADPDSAAFNTSRTVKARDSEAVNTKLPTGEIEVFAREIEILSKAAELPLPVFDEPDYPEDIRLKYRFLDLRRETLHKNIMLRTQIIAKMRERMSGAGFNEFSTPILTASSPEGARDFLVPSRIHNGEFYALPQAPQQYKQLIMMSGFDTYFQIAPCFRDEDPRADRLPGEFYQLDLEMSFVEQDDILQTMEPVMRGVFEDFAEGKPVTQEFRRIPYDEAMRKYGSDKPDLRNPIEMQDVSEHFRGSDFKVFAGILDADEKNQVWAIPTKGAGSRKASGSYCEKHWSRTCRSTSSATWDWNWVMLYFLQQVIRQNLLPLRVMLVRKAAEDNALIDEDRFELCWIVDFPFYEWDEDNKKVEFAHNPFSMPQGGMDALENQDPLTIKAFQYDLVCNGFEIASGLDQSTVEERFGGLYRAFQYGAPPHGGYGGLVLTVL